MRRSWGEKYIEAHANRYVDFDIDDTEEDRVDEEGLLFGFEEAADHAYDEDFFREEVLFDDE